MKVVEYKNLWRGEDCLQCLIFQVSGIIVLSKYSTFSSYCTPGYSPIYGMVDKYFLNKAPKDKGPWTIIMFRYPLKNILMSWTTFLTMSLATERYLAVCRYVILLYIVNITPSFLLLCDLNESNSVYMGIYLLNGAAKCTKIQCKEFLVDSHQQL